MPLTLNDLNNDVLHVICVFVDISVTALDRGISALPIKNLSLVNHRLRSITIPFLFRKVRVLGPQGRSSLLTEGDWTSGRRAIHDLEKSIAQHIRTFKFDIYGSDVPVKDVQTENMQALARFLGRMPQLQRLTIYIPRPHVPAFLTAMNEAKIELCSVDTAVFNPYLIAIMSYCPNVEAMAIHISHYGASLSSESPETLEEFQRQCYDVMSKATKLRHLDSRGLWSVKDIETLHGVAPRLQRLTMRQGGLDGYASPIADVCSALAPFKYLTRLDLADAADLGLGFDGGPWCGNAYDGPDGQELLKRVTRQGEEAEAQAADLAFKHVRTLKEVWVGDSSRAVRAGGYLADLNEYTWYRGRHLERKDLEF